MQDPHAALINLMVMVSASDADMTDEELRVIGDTVRLLPVFRGFDQDDLPRLAREVTAMLQAADGLDQAMTQIEESLPPHLRETAYALACDVAAADGKASQEELRLLEIVRHRLGIDRLTAAAIERGARARHMPL